ncbi:hypothetical protein QTP88_000983 [Uroleucon formosanum]
MPLLHNEKVILLKKDILNSSFHVFGSHSECSSYFCSSPKDNEIDLVPQMKSCGLWADISGAINIVAHHAQSLIYNLNNNAVEGFNSVVAKFVGGKKVNFSLRGSYSARCNAAVSSFNFGPKYLNSLHKKVTNVSPGIYTKKFISKIDKSRKFEKKQKCIAGPDEDYGAVEIEIGIIDMSPEEYNAKKIAFLKKIYLSVDELIKIERNTKTSNFGKVCKLRSTTSRANTIKYILYDIFPGSSSTRYGIENESIARNAFQKTIKEKIEPAGLFIHKNKPYLAASPDVNRIYSRRGSTQKKKIKYMISDGEKITLKKTDNYYYQVQAQLNITESNYCYFVVWTPKGFIVDKISKDVKFWTSKIEPFVTTSYIESLLAEIIDPGFDRGLPIRSGIPTKKL